MNENTPMEEFAFTEGTESVSIVKANTTTGWHAYLGNSRVTCHGSLVIPIKISLVSTFLS